MMGERSGPDIRCPAASRSGGRRAGQPRADGDRVEPLDNGAGRGSRRRLTGQEYGEKGREASHGGRPDQWRVLRWLVAPRQPGPACWERMIAFCQSWSMAE
jgi:hypothetical protein